MINYSIYKTLDSSHEGIDGSMSLLANRAARQSSQPVVVSQSSCQSVAADSRGRSMQPVQDSRGSLKSSQNRCQEGSGALRRSQVYSCSAKIALKRSSGVPQSAFRAARGAPRAPRGGPTEPPERPGAAQSESKRGSGAIPRANV